MKRLLLAVVFLILTPALLSAQKGFHLQFFVQPQLKMINGDFYPYNFAGVNENYYSMDSRFGFGLAGGVKGTYMSNEKSGISLGVLYSSQGQSYETLELTSVSGVVGRFDLDISCDYLKLPFAFEYIAKPAGKTSFFFNVGGYVGFLTDYSLAQRQSFTVVNTNTVLSYSTIDVSDLMVSTSSSTFEQNLVLTEKIFNGTSYGVHAGVGFIFNVSEKVSIPLSVNYDLDITDMKNTNAIVKDILRYFDEYFWEFIGEPNLVESFYNSTISLRVGVQIKL